MIETLEKLARMGCRIVPSLTSLPINSVTILVHDLGSDLYYIGPSWSSKFYFEFVNDSIPQRPIPVEGGDGILSITIDGKVCWLFTDFATLNIKLRDRRSQLLEQVTLDEYAKHYESGIDLGQHE